MKNIGEKKGFSIELIGVLEIKIKWSGNFLKKY